MRQREKGIGMETKGTALAENFMETAGGVRDKEIEKDEQNSPRTYV
jgi:hypothetical protein